MFFGKKVKINVKNKNIVIEARSGANLFNVLKENGILIESLCQGNGQCGKCKVKIASADGKEINKPSKKDRLVLAKINLDNGYRLACQYIVKSDIIVDTEEWIVDEDPNIVKVTVKKLSQEQRHNEENQTFTEEETPKSDIPNTTHKEESQTPELKELKDGLILIQYPKGIKYFVYSASIANISFDGYVKSDEPLIDLIDNNLISDFIYNYVDVPDIDRVLIILDQNVYNGAELLNLIKYHSFNIGEMFCEIIQPMNEPSDLLSFFRLISLQDESVLIPFDNMQNIFYLSDKSLYFLDTKYLFNSKNINFLLNTRLNPIVDISDDLKELHVKDSYFEPDSLSPKVILKTLKILQDYGIMDKNFVFKDRTELLDKAPIDLLVKLSKKDEETRYYIYRKKETELYISDKQIEQLKNLKKFLNSLFHYIEKYLGKIASLNIYSYQNIEDSASNFFDLGILPKKLAKRTVFFSGDPALLSTKFFGYKSVPAYINTHFKDLNYVELYKNENFNEILKK